MSNEKKIRIPLWIYPSVQDKIAKNYKEDNCKSPGEFIEKELSISVSTVRRARKDLGNAGLVRKEYAYRDNGSFTSNRYYLR